MLKDHAMALGGDYEVYDNREPAASYAGPGTEHQVFLSVGKRKVQ
jgi:hypothetical protein